MHKISKPSSWFSEKIKYLIKSENTPLFKKYCLKNSKYEGVPVSRTSKTNKSKNELVISIGLHFD